MGDYCPSRPLLQLRIGSGVCSQDSTSTTINAELSLNSTSGTASHKSNRVQYYESSAKIGSLASYRHSHQGKLIPY